MSEQNILNPTQASLFNPDFGYTEGLPEMRLNFQAASGKLFSRRQFARGRAYELAWNDRDLATKHTLQQWERQYENDFFTLADWERARYFSGRFEAPLIFTPAANEKYNIRGRFIELPGQALFAYPSNWARDAIFLEERNGFGEDMVKLTGTWVYDNTDFNWHGGAHYQSAITNDTAEWIYFGHGFRFWSVKAVSLGIVEVTATRVSSGAVAQVTNVDLYNATEIPAAALLTATNFLLDLYRVKLRVTGTKNALASTVTCGADAIEVMQ